MEDNAPINITNLETLSCASNPLPKELQIVTIKAFCFKKSLLVKNPTSWQKGGGSQHASSWTSGQVYCLSFGFNVC